MHLLLLVSHLLQASLTIESRGHDAAEDLLIELRRLGIEGPFVEAAARIPEAIRIARTSDPIDAAELWSRVGFIHHSLWLLDTAVAEYRFGLRQLVGQPSSVVEVLLLSNLATLYLEVGGHPHEAELLCRRGLIVAVKIESLGSSGRLRLLLGLAGVRREMGDPEGARKLCGEVLDSAGTSPIHRMHRGAAPSILGRIALEHRDPSGALNYFDGSISEIGLAYGHDHPDLIPAQLGLATAYNQLRQWDRSDAAARQALELAERFGSTNALLGRILEALALTKRHTGMGREAKDLEARARSLAASEGSVAKRLQVHVSDLRPLEIGTLPLDSIVSCLALAQR